METDSLQRVRDYLRRESKNRVLYETGHSLYGCLNECLDSLLQDMTKRHPMEKYEQELNGFRSTKELKSKTLTLLKDHAKNFKVVLSLVVKESRVEEPNRGESNSTDYHHRLDDFYSEVVSHCEGEGDKNQINLSLYAVATCINTPIYVITEDNQWQYIQPLFEYQGQPKRVLRYTRYITMYLSSEKRFHRIESNDHMAPPPKAEGIVGMYVKILEEISTESISVPRQLKQLNQAARQMLCENIKRETFTECWNILKANSRLSEQDYGRLTAHRSSLEESRAKILDSQEYFETLCKVLIKRKDKGTLKVCGLNWDKLVISCEYLFQTAALIELDRAVRERNYYVQALVNACSLGEEELNERRKRVTSAVIASSSIGLLSGGLVIAGIVLAPFSLGASFGLSVAGGAIGVGTGIASGTARVVEAVKQNSKLDDIAKVEADIREKEGNVSIALMQVEEAFKEWSARFEESAKNTPGISQRGFLAIGSALRSAKSVASVVLAVGRFGSTAATVSAAVLGPLSLVFDVAFLAEAAHNKSEGDKTEAGTKLRTMADTVKMKCKIFNSILRGNVADQQRMFDWS